MEWTYRITKPLTIDTRSLYKVSPVAVFPELAGSLTFSPGEIDEILYVSLAKGYPDCVERVPKNELVAAVWRARGLA